MITETYVSFEVAKLLREKGFYENTEHKIWYVIKQFSTGCHWNPCTYKVGDITREYNNDCCISMPTLQMAMKWLRLTYKLHIVAEPSLYNSATAESDFSRWLWTIITEDSYLYSEGEDFPTYESAAEAALKHCLENLI